MIRRADAKQNTPNVHATDEADWPLAEPTDAESRAAAAREDAQPSAEPAEGSCDRPIDPERIGRDADAAGASPEQAAPAAEDTVAPSHASAAHPFPAAPASPGRHAALYGLLTALALCAGYLELLIPLPVGVPGVKLGLGNAVVLFALERMGARPALYVMLAKVLCSMLLFSTPQMLAFSLAGGLLSWAVMALAVRFSPFSEVGVSVLGGVAHNAGQLLAVAALLSPQTALAAAPVLAVAGVLCGAAIGLILHGVLAAIPQEVFHG